LLDTEGVYNRLRIRLRNRLHCTIKKYRCQYQNPARELLGQGVKPGERGLGGPSYRRVSAPRPRGGRVCEPGRAGQPHIWV